MEKMLQQGYAVADRSLAELDAVLHLVGPTREALRGLLARVWIEGQIEALNKMSIPRGAA